jgi:hypothetical protein
MTTITVRFADHVAKDYQDGLMAELMADMDAEVENVSPGRWRIVSRRERRTESVMSQLESEAKEGCLLIEDRKG